MYISETLTVNILLLCCQLWRWRKATCNQKVPSQGEAITPAYDILEAGELRKSFLSAELSKYLFWFNIIEFILEYTLKTWLFVLLYVTLFSDTPAIQTLHICMRWRVWNGKWKSFEITKYFHFDILNLKVAKQKKPFVSLSGRFR